jgi:hypothetical protein
MHLVKCGAHSPAIRSDVGSRGALGWGVIGAGSVWCSLGEDMAMASLGSPTPPVDSRRSEGKSAIRREKKAG